MNSLATTDNKPIRRQPICDPRRPLAILFAAYPEPFAKGDTEQLRRAQVEAYMLALDGVPEWAIRESVTAFIQGTVERSSRSKLPTAEQIAALARDKVADESSRQRRRIEDERQRAERQEYLSRPKLSDAERAERAARADAIMRRHGLKPMESGD